jgi:hypothetical protein
MTARLRRFHSGFGQTRKRGHGGETMTTLELREIDTREAASIYKDRNPAGADFTTMYVCGLRYRNEMKETGTN